MIAPCTRFGSPYALVHVAGGAGPKRARDIEDFQLSEWSHVIDLNLTSAFLAARAVVPMMRKQRRGRIVVFSSVIANGEKGPLTTVTGRLPYATAKAALLGFTSQLAKDLDRVRHHGERVDARPDPWRTRHAHPRQVRQSRTGAEEGLARRISRADVRAPATRSLPPSTICSRRLRDSPPASLCRSTAPISRVRPDAISLVSLADD